MMKFKGTLCYNKLFWFILKQQIRTETGSLDRTESKVKPTVLSPLRKVASFPMRLKCLQSYFLLKFDPPVHETRALSYLSTRKVYEIELTCDELAVMIGNEWFYTFGGVEVAVHVGKVLIRLQEKQRVEYKTNLNMNWAQSLSERQWKVKRAIFVVLSFLIGM